MAEARDTRRGQRTGAESARSSEAKDSVAVTTSPIALPAERRMGTHFLGNILALVGAVAMAGVSAFLRVVAGEVDPFVGAFARQIPIVIVLAIAIIILRPKALQPRHKEFIGPKIGLLLVSGGVAGILVGNGLLFYSLDWIGLAVATAAVTGANLVGAALISWIFLRERPSGVQWLGTLLILGGLAAIGISATDASTSSGKPLDLGLALLGFGFALITGLTYAFSASNSRLAQGRPNRFFPTLAHITFGGVAALIILLLILTGGNLSLAFAPITAHQWLVLLLAGATNAVALTTITLALRYTTVTSVMMLNSLVIVFGVVAGVIFFNESVSIALTIGCALILIGVGVAQVRSRPTRIAATHTRANGRAARANAKP